MGGPGECGMGVLGYCLMMLGSRRGLGWKGGNFAHDFRIGRGKLPGSGIWFLGIRIRSAGRTLFIIISSGGCELLNGIPRH